MNSDMQRQEGYAKSHRRKKRWLQAVTCLAAAVVFCTTYALILPAITMEKVQCPLEEHTHTEECYTHVASEPRLEPVCTVESLNLHRHTESCYGGDGELVCGYADFVLHQHDASCYDETGSLWCPLPETTPHIHSESCYAAGEAAAAHTHTDACYAWVRGELICTIPTEPVQAEEPVQAGEEPAPTGEETIPAGETPAAHEHTDACYAWVPGELICTLSSEPVPAEPQLICGLAETIPHQHSDACLNEADALACGLLELREHVHTEACFRTVEEEPLTCTLPEDGNHTHGPLCYGVWELTCGLEEHTHTAECGGLEEGIAGEDILQEGTLMPLSAPIPDDEVAGGAIEGTELTWRLTKSASGEYTLTISGTGPIPNYTAASATPWYDYIGSDRQRIPARLVLEEGVTEIGNYAFSSCCITDVSISSTVGSIGEHAFEKCQMLTSVVIPESVTDLGPFCFSRISSLTSVTLSEGLKSMAGDAFNLSGLQTLHLPASLTEISGDAGIPSIAQAITVAEGNPVFHSVDGVLFMRNDSEWDLLTYPTNKAADVYTIPEVIENSPVTTIRMRAFYFVTQLRKVVIPASVTSLDHAFQYATSIQEVELQSSTLNPGTGAFSYMQNLREITFNNLTGAIPNNFLLSDDYTLNALSTITIPEGITGIGTQAFYSCYNLSTVTFNAGNAHSNGNPFRTKDLPRFALTIGAEVDVLDETFHYFAERADSLCFAPSNQITIAPGALAGAPAPFSGLSGTIWVDGQGAIYTYDKTEGTAALFYCPAGVEALNVPGTIAPNGVTCTVNTVQQNALKYAAGLTTVTFDAPQKITCLEDYALANCPTLKSVNGKTVVADAQKLFTSCEKPGYNLFFNTGLTGAGSSGTPDTMDGAKGLTVKLNGATDMSISASGGNWSASDDKGGYSLLTGETLTVNANVGNISETTFCYRVYFELTGGDGGTLSIKPGETYTFGDGTHTQQAICYATEDPCTVYLEFTPAAGATGGVSVTANYPTPTSAGGGLNVWGRILTEDEAKKNKGKLMEPGEEGSIQAYWKTAPASFALTKTAANQTALNIVGVDGGAAQPDAEMWWMIKLSLEGSTQSYGKDYAKWADFTDTMTLPAGVAWSETAKTAIQNSTARWSGADLYAGDVLIAQVKMGSSASLSLVDRSVAWDETADTAVFKWRVRNTSDKAELGAVTVSFYVYPAALSVDMEKFSQETDGIIQNQASAEVSYHYCAPKTVESNIAEKHIQGGTGSIQVEKTATEVKYFGEDVTYTLGVYNKGALPWTGDVQDSYTLKDTLNQSIYIRPENLQKMFDDTHGGSLTVTIENAALGKWEQVTGAEGGTAWRTPENSTMGTAGHTLTITKGQDGRYQVAVNGSSTYTGSTVAEALEAAGYGVTTAAIYTCTWTLNGGDENCTFAGGEHREFVIYATVKDSFQQAPHDWPGGYAQTETNTIASTTAYVRDPLGNEIAKTGYVPAHKVMREAFLDKRAYQDGVHVPEMPKVNNGDVLDYEIEFTHFGAGAYENLPMVEDIYGSQYLLVPADKNPGLSGKETVTYGGKTYYKLTEGTYTNVAVGVDDTGCLLTAESITVEKVTGSGEEKPYVELGGNRKYYTGMHTTVKWYFPHGDGGNYRKTVRFQVVVDTEAGDGISYDLGSVAWMNDRAGARIYSFFWGAGTIVQFDKDIVERRGTAPANDVLNREDHTLLAAGDTVTYRITLKNTGDLSFTLTGKELADALPDTHGVFEWTMGNNVQLEVDSEGYVTCGNLKEGNITNTRPSTSMPKGRQYIVWPEDASICFNGKGSVYLYVTLTYPGNNAGGKATWSDYAAKVGGSTLDNTMYVYGFPSVVTHELRETGKALLQKGVYGMYYYDDSATAQRTYTQAGSSRTVYNNRDSKNRAVAYYVTLYNGGSKRLYLNDLHDKLPDGFTFQHMLQNGNLSHLSQLQTITTPGGTLGSYPLVNAEGVTYCSVGITAEKNEGGVTFRITKPGSGSNPAAYDETRGQYYLNQGEAIVFGYMCDIGPSDKTNNAATNAVAMPYTDQPATDVSIVPAADMRVSAGGSGFEDANDGSRAAMSAAGVKEKYGFADGGGDGTWLVSDVTVRRGEIIPGVTKVTESYTQGGVTNEYTTHVGPTDVVNWSVTLSNGGAQAITDYTFEDSMPSPYVIVGDITGTIRDKDGKEVLTQTLLSFPKDRSENETSVTVTRKGKPYKVTLDGTETDLDSGLSISLNREGGNEVLKLHLQDASFSIPEGGKMEIGLSCKNPTTNQISTVYTNYATLTPTQAFTRHGEGQIVKEADKPVSVRNYSSVTVATGLVTSSEKRVTDGTHTAVSSGQVNTILLPDAGQEFTYTLSVTNSTGEAMEKLVLIDNLPEVGDHSPFSTAAPRGSEFRVRFAETPAVTVKVTAKDGKEITLLASQYTVLYAEDTNFGEPQSADWKGESTGTTASWTASSANARAIRIIIEDKSDPTSSKVQPIIPDGATVSVTFHAKVEGDAAPGSIAWNSFGYHYAIGDTELESMPMVVGVKVPDVPALEKKLVDVSGVPAAAEREETFQFLVYTGEALPGSYATEEAWIAALNGREYHVFSVTVPKGASASEETLLKADGWTWTEGQKYTIVELPGDGRYAFRSFNGIDASQCSFTYQGAETLTFTCENLFQKWRIGLTKVDHTNPDVFLPGAVFALYSPVEGDKIDNIPAEYTELAIEQTIQNGTETWYLARVGTTGADGALAFEGLLREKYYLLEVKAPAGYALSETPGQTIYRTAAKDGAYALTVENRKGYELPEAGGAGTAPYTLGGLLALCAGVLLLYKKCKKEGSASS